MRFSFWADTGKPWDKVVEACSHAEATGWDGVWVADHFMPNVDGYDPTADPSDTELAPMLEAWTMLGGLAATVPRVRLGTMVTGNTYRHPAVLANMAATVDHISGGRVVLGIGAGWQENEHHRYGLELGSVAERSDRFEEACEVLRALCRDERVDFDGRYYQLTAAPMAPKPVQKPLPLLVGGGGERRTLRTAARFADEWNVWGSPDDLRHKIRVLERHCADVGRDPADIEKSAAALMIMTDTEELAEQFRAGLAHRGGLVGTVEQLREIVADYVAAGVDEVIVPEFTMTPENRNETLDRFRAEVIEQV